MQGNPIRSLIPWGSGRAYAPTGTGILLYGRGCITYNEAYETSGSAGVTANFYDGTSNNGQSIIDYTLTQGESTSEMWGMHWVQFTEGLYVVSSTANIAGSVHVWVDHDCSEYNGALYHMARLAQIELELRVAQLGGYVPSSGA